MKFALGEIVIMVGGHANGAEAEVVQLRPEDYKGERKDYRVKINGFPSINPAGWRCMEASLRKKNPPEEKIDWEEKLSLKQPKEIA